MRSTRALAAAGAAAALTLAAPGCDDGEQSARAPAPSVSSAAPRQQPARAVRIAVVTHGEAGGLLWSIVRRGVNQAARDLGASVTYRSADTFTPARMAKLIDDAVATHPDGLVVSIPETTTVGPAVTRAVAARIPVVAINSGETAYRRLGALLFVGQPEYAAGLGAGRRMAAAGVRNGLCVNHQQGVSSLVARCRGFAAALAAAGGRSRVVVTDLQNQRAAERRIAAAASAGGVDGVLALGPGGANPALRAVEERGLAGRVKLASFDLAPEILRAVRSRRILFTVDQQPYLQGYLPIVFLAQRRLYGLAPVRGTVIPTGPSFVTRANVARVQKLTEAGIR